MHQNIFIFCKIIMEDSKLTSRKVDTYCLPCNCSGIGTNTKLQIFLFLTLGTVLVPELLFFYQGNFISYWQRCI